MSNDLTERRRFLSMTAGGLGIAGLLPQIGQLSAQDAEVSGIAPMREDIEPLVRFFEETPRERIIDLTVRKIKTGVTYRQLLAALLLAGVRNVQPRPSVGFKFHAVLVVNSAHLASLASTDSDRWLPLLWAIDNFKNSQARDQREGDWTMPAVDQASLPAPDKAAAMLEAALNDWDAPQADVAITSLTRHFGANYVYERLAAHSARDYRSIGHKAIYLSNAFRTLRTIGWEYAEPVMRSLVYAMQNHTGESNPGTSDHDADRPGRVNRERIAQITGDWKTGAIDSSATVDLLHTIRDGGPLDASAKVTELLAGGTSVQSVWDGIYGAAGELLMRQRGIVSMHGVTTTNALHHIYTTSADEETRKYVLLQNASFLTMFRESARSRGQLLDRPIDKLEPLETAANAEDAVPGIFRTLGSNRTEACRQLYGYLRSDGNPKPVVDHARRLVFLKGNDSHDYKFSSAALEDYRSLSRDWRDRFLAASSYQLRSETEKDRSLSRRVLEAFG